MPTITTPAKEYDVNWSLNKLSYNPYPLNFNKHSISVDLPKQNWSSLWNGNKSNKFWKRKSQIWYSVNV